jgi:tetratricopeptide (TPR) repeat protein
VRNCLSALAGAIYLGVVLSFAANASSPLDSETAWEKARHDLAQGRAGEAKAGFEDLLKKYPNEPDLHLFLGMSLLRLRDPQGAIRAINRAIAVDPKHIEAHTLLGYIELEIRADAAAAMREYRKVVELKPDSPEAHNNLAVALKKHGDLDEALSSLNRALELKPSFVGALTTRGGVYAEQGKWTEARRDFEQALKIDPNDDGALYGLSQAAREAKDYAGAQGALSELISRSGNFVYWLEWGRVVMVRYWWGLLLIAIGWAFKGRFMKARTQANG